MSYYITDTCINCGVCEPECPNQAIVMGDEQYQIRQGRCTECITEESGPHCVRLCPIDSCIIVNPHRPESAEMLHAKVKRLALKAAFEAFDQNSN